MPTSNKAKPLGNWRKGRAADRVMSIEIFYSYIFYAVSLLLMAFFYGQLVYIVIKVSTLALAVGCFVRVTHCYHCKP